MKFCGFLYLISRLDIIFCIFVMEIFPNLCTPQSFIPENCHTHFHIRSNCVINNGWKLRISESIRKLEMNNFLRTSHEPLAFSQYTQGLGECVRTLCQENTGDKWDPRTSIYFFSFKGHQA